jgi:hypothetical protein
MLSPKYRDHDEVLRISYLFQGDVLIWVTSLPIRNKMSCFSHVVGDIEEVDGGVV